MNRRATYFLQRILSGLATSIIYAVFDDYRYNQRRKPRRKKVEPSFYRTDYDTKDIYKRN